MLLTILCLGITILYLPILVLIAFSFNASPLVNVWGGFSTAWYFQLLHNRQLLQAALLSLEVAVTASTAAVVLGTMAAIIQCARQFSLHVAREMSSGGGALEASMAKAYVCRAAEWVTREAMQIHGGMGYAEEYAVSRYFLDARVLSIFEGADETLCLKVIARRLVDQIN